MRKLGDTMDAIKEALSKLPRGESVFRCDELHTGETAGSINFRLQPKQITDSISLYAKQCGLNFT